MQELIFPIRKNKRVKNRFLLERVLKFVHVHILVKTQLFISAKIFRTVFNHHLNKKNQKTDSDHKLNVLKESLLLLFVLYSLRKEEEVVVGCCAGYLKGHCG